MVVVKKYSNRRLYDTGDSRYITLEDLARKIRGGADVRVLDAKSGDDLTQATLTQIIIESRGAARLLPVPLLVQLIRMGDDALAEFFGRFISWALELYVQMRQGAQAVAPYNPFASIPFAASNAFARLFSRGTGWGDAPPRSPWAQVAEPVAPYGEPGEPPLDDPHAGPPPRPRAGRQADADDVASLRRELEELREAIHKSPRRKKK